MKLFTSSLLLHIAAAFQPTSKPRLPSHLCSSTPPRRADDVNKKPEQLRREIASRNSQVANEEKYGVADGEFLDAVGDFEGESATETATNTERTDALQKKMERITKPRAYPLFLAEKLAEIAEYTISDLKKALPGSEGDEPFASKEKKERVVILGTGWGAASLIKSIDTSVYDVTVVSPRNYFLFTPMLAGASVGTVEYRSICEPIREINRKVSFLEATATSVDPEHNRITCESVVCEGNSCDIEEFVLDYDRLVVSVGAQTNTFGIPGVKEHCNYLKQVDDARRIRTSIVNCFERANLPNLSDEERTQNLSFCVIGAGPTGIEFAAELRDFIEQDGPKYYPDLLKFVRIKVIEASPVVLAPFDKELQEEAVKQMNKVSEIKDPRAKDLLPERYKLTELMLEASVKEVKEDIIVLGDGTNVPYGLAVWAAGNGPIPFTLQLIDELGDAQKNAQDVARGRIVVDPWMRAEGSNGKILAFGDCTCRVDAQLPATAQVASQQGEYLASLFNKRYELSPQVENDILPPPAKTAETLPSTVADSIAAFAMNSGDFAKPFQFLNLGILAYTGSGSALAQVNPSPKSKPVKGKGKIGNAVWRSVYLSKQVSWRNRLLVLNDWTKRQIFGRDITRL